MPNHDITEEECVNLYVRPGRVGDPVKAWTMEIAPAYPRLILRCGDNGYLDTETMPPPDDFLGFPYTIEVYLASGDTMPEASFIEAVASVMNALAARGCEVQAASQYESQLPGRGRLEGER